MSPISKIGLGTKVEYQEKRLYELLTRLINVTVAFLGLVFLAPLLLVVAVAIKLSDPRAPIYYRGRRIGKGGKIFPILKFRTMASGVEQQIGARLIDKESPLITPLGKLMRRRKLDEIPQLLNVLRGEMNLVGPRPAREVFLEELRERIPGYDRRFLVKPGITGLAQVCAGYYTDPRHKLRYELIYIKRRSILLDLKLIVATLLIMGSRILTLFGLLFLLLAFVTFVPTTFVPSLRVGLLGLHLNVAYVLIAFLVSGWLTQKLYRKELMLLRRTPADKCIIGFILSATLGALLNGNGTGDFLGVLYFCSGAFVLYFLAAQVVDHDLGKIRWYLKVLGLITVIVSLRGILEHLAGEAAGAAGDRIVSLLGDPNVFALYLAIVFPVLLYLRWTSSERLARFFWSGSIIAAGSCSFLTSSRSGCFTLLIAVLAFLSRWQRPLFYSMLLALVGIVFIAQFEKGDYFSLRQIVNSPATSRIIQQHAAVLSSSRDHMILGVGWRNWRTALDTEESDEGGTPVEPLSLPRLKSMYLILLAEYGVVGLFFMLLIFVTILKDIYDGSYRIPQPSLQVLMWAIFSSILGFLVNMFLFDSFYFIVVQATFWMLLGLGVGIALEFNPPSQRWYRFLQFRY